MALVADTQHAVEMLCGMQTELQQTGDEELGQQLSDMINMLESPLFTQLLTLQQSMRQLRDHVESTPPGQPVGEFDFTPSGDLVIEEPPQPEPVEQPGQAHPYAYENVIDLEDEIGRVQVAAVEQSAPPPPLVAADELDTGDALLDSIAELAMGREVTTVKLMKPEKGGLGFSVVGLKSENHGELGIFVQQIQPKGVAERNGDLHESDQILAINGHLLDLSVSHQQAIEMLQKVKGLVELVVARGIFQLPENALKNADTPKEEEQLPSPQKPEDAQIEPPQHEIQQIELYNDGSGLGFGIVGVRDVGIMVKTILPGGTADKDGRLQSGDIILQIGDTPLQGMTSDQVAMVLRQAGSHVRLTVARSAFPVEGAPKDAEPPSQPEPVIQPRQMAEDHSQPPPQPNLEENLEGVRIFDVVLEKEAKGLGITIAGYVRDVSTGQVSGIFIKKISEGSAADRNGNVKVNDQIIEVDGHGLDGFTNVEAVDMLRNTGSVVHVKLARHPEGTLDISNVNMEKSEERVHSEHIQPTRVENEEEAPPLAPPAYPPPVGILEPVEPDPEPEVPMETYEGELSTETEVRLISAWQAIIGDDVMIVVAQLSKFREGGGLGISLEGTVDIDESGEEVRPHHYIRSILADGPVGHNAQLKSGDELLEVNGEQLLGLNHVDVVKTLKELPMHVRIVCARHPHPVFPEATEVPKIEEVVVTPDVQEEVFTTSQSSPQESLPFPEVVAAGSMLAVRTSFGDNNSSDRASPLSPLSRESLGGLAVWDDELQTVDLIKGDRGLGFSILDYQDPLNPTKTVIVIRSLVQGGVAESDGRLIPGDRLAFVNDGNLDNCTLEMAVQALKGAPPGRVLLGVAKPLPQPMDGTLEGEEPMIMSQQIASVHQAPPSSSQDISSQDEDLQKIRELQASLYTSQQIPSWDARPNEDEELVEEVIMCASVSSNVESTMDLSQILSDKPEPEVAPPASAAPPDLVLASTLSLTKPQETDQGNAAPVPAVRSTPPEPRRHPPPPPPKPAPPPKPSPRSSPAAAAPAASAVEDSQRSGVDPRVAAVAASYSPLSKGASIVLPNFLEKSIVLKKGNAGLGLTVNADKLNGVMVKSIIRGGAVHHDGRLAMGDLITSVNDESVRGLTNAEARASLRKASLIGSDISITYIPASDASAYRENPSSIPVPAADPNVSQPEGSAVAAPKLPTSPLPAEDGSESDKFTLPLRDQPSDSVKLASVALSPVSVTSGSEWDAIRTVRLTKEPNKSLGISIVGGRAGDGQPVQGIYIKHVLDDSQAGRTHALKTGDRILEVNGCDLRDASHDYAVAIIRNAANPVCFVVQSLSAGANMPTGAVSVITNDEEDQVVAVAAESSETLPPASDVKEEVTTEGRRDEKEVAAGKEDCKGEEEIPAGKEDYNVVETAPDGLKVTDLELIPLSPLKHQLSLSGSEDEDDEKKDVDSSREAEIVREYSNLDGEIFAVNLTKSSKGLGISLAGNRDRSKMSVFVVGVDPAGAAAQDGRLHVADEILKINSLSVFGKSHQKASAVIKEIPRDGEVELIVRRHPLAMDQLAVTPLTPTPSKKLQTLDLIQPDPTPVKPEPDQNKMLVSYPNVHTVVINKGTRGLGFAIFEKQDSFGKCGIFIRDIIPGGAADEEGSLRGGDHILSVDDNTLVDTKKKDAIAVLKATTGKVCLTISCERPLVHSPSEDGDTESIERRDGEEVIEEEETIVAAQVTTEEHALPSLMEELMKAGVVAKDGGEVEMEDGGMMEDQRDREGDDNTEEEEDGVKADREQEEETERRAEDVDQVVQASVVQIQHHEPTEDVKSHHVEAPAPDVEPEKDTPTPDVEPKEDTPTPDVEPKEDTPTLDVEPKEDTHIPDVEPKEDTPTPDVEPKEDTPTPDVEPKALLSTPNVEPEENTPTPDPYTRPILPGVPTDIIVDKGKTGLGLSIVGGVDTQLNIVVVHEVYEQRAAARDGRLWPGDQLIQVNGIDLTNARHDDAINALRQSPAHIRMTVYRDQQATREAAVVVVKGHVEEEETVQDEEEEFDKMLSVELKRTPGRRLGVNIVGDRSGRGVEVSMILKGTAAHAEGTLMAGDHILSINGKDVQNATREEVATLLKATEGHVLFEIGRKKEESLRSSQPAEQIAKAQVEPAGTAGKPVRHVELKKVPGKSLGLSIAGGKGSEMGDIPLIIASITPGSQADEIKHLKVLDCIEGINGHSVAGLSYANAIHLLKSSQGVIRLDVSELNPTMKGWYLKSQQAGGKGDSMVAVKASIQKPAAAVAAEETSAGRVKTIELQRGPDGLGFSIVGGFGSPHGDLPIYIKTVFNKGAATVSGELKRGDQIIAVNGESLDGATHEQAVDVLKRAKGEVIMTVLA